MWIANDIAELHGERNSGVTIGAFDGVHLGHQALIKQMVADAERAGLEPVVVTFDPLPGQVMDRGTYQLLTSLDERIDRIEKLGVAGIVVLEFSPALRTLSAQAFLNLLVDGLGLQSLWIGPDFRLGRDREGTPEILAALGQRHGFRVSVQETPVHWGGRPVRSSRIRRALRSGNIEEANGCLGYAYALSGIVEHGDQRGRQLGFPTANIKVDPERLLPWNGVYICRAQLEGGLSSKVASEGSTFDAITNVGTRPTFNGHSATVEAYLLDFAADIYGQTLKLEFRKRIRAELRFASVEALVARMKQDEEVTRDWLRAT
jgi:riboflavin kinase/FMN adenylyltransferase